MCQVSSVKMIGFLALKHTFSLFHKKMYLMWRAEKSLAINWKTEFPDFSLAMPISKIFLDFLKNSPTFP